MKPYESIKIALILFQEQDVVTLSSGNNNDGFGTDLDNGEVGGTDIFN